MFYLAFVEVAVIETFTRYQVALPKDVGVRAIGNMLPDVTYAIEGFREFRRPYLPF